MLSNEEILELYRNPNFGGSFSGVRVFRDYIFAEKNELVSLKRLYDVLKTDRNYLMHMKPVRSFPRRPYHVNGFGDIVQMDLMEMPNFDGYRYALILVDVFSRHLYAVPLKQKTGAEVGAGFEQLYKEFQSPISKLESDKGQEFLSNKKLFQKLGIYFHTKGQTHKANFCEAAIGLIKQKLYMTLRSELSQNWPYYLDLTIKGLNNRHITDLGGIQPSAINSVWDDEKIRSAKKAHRIETFKEPDWHTQNQNQEAFLKSSENPFPIGTYVYLDLKPTTFDKSYDIQVKPLFLYWYHVDFFMLHNLRDHFSSFGNISFFYVTCFFVFVTICFL